jgi:hypothetical protein
MNDYGVWLTKRDERNEALQNAARRRLTKQVLAQRPGTSPTPPFSHILCHAGLMVSIILALLGRR